MRTRSMPAPRRLLSMLLTRARRFGTAVVIVAGALILVEAWPRVFDTNVRIGAVGLELTPRELRTGENISPVYKTIRDSNRPIALLEYLDDLGLDVSPLV